jgi:hypothetical protein
MRHPFDPNVQEDSTMTTLNAFAAEENMEEITTRLRNLLTGRRFTMVRRYVGQNVTPEVEAGLVLDTGGIYGTGVGMDRNRRVAFFAARPGYRGLNIETRFKTEAAAAEAYKTRSKYDQSFTIVDIDGGSEPGDITARSRIVVEVTNTEGVTIEYVIVPAYVPQQVQVEAEADVLDRAAAYLAQFPDAGVEDVNRLRQAASSARLSGRSAVNPGPPPGKVLISNPWAKPTDPPKDA